MVCRDEVYGQINGGGGVLHHDEIVVDECVVVVDRVLSALINVIMIENEI